MAATLTYETEGGIAVLTLRREERRNAINRAMIADLTEAIDAFEADDGARVLVVTGAGSAFSAGADIKERAENAGDMSVQRTSLHISPLFRRLELTGKVVIAAINGPAVGGGCELALACDLRVAARSAVFALPEVRLGILPGAGGTQRLPRVVGPARAKEMMLLARYLDAEAALGWGLVNEVAEDAELMPRARALAAEIIEMAPVALGVIKSAVDKAQDLDLDAGLAFEAGMLAGRRRHRRPRRGLPSVRREAQAPLHRPLEGAPSGAAEGAQERPPGYANGRLCDICSIVGANITDGLGLVGGMHRWSPLSTCSHWWRCCWPH